MFEKYTKKSEPDLESIGDEELLGRYRLTQERTVKLQKRSETSKWYKGTGKTATERESRQYTKKAQREAELAFAELNVLRQEIDKRGLKVSTLEERGEIK